jgi:small subunit ribosomal protein S4
MGDPRRLRKKYEKPFKRWDKQRIIEERKLMEAYGLKNKKELWKLQTILRKYRHMARKFVGMPEEEKKEKEETLLNKLIKIGLLKPGATLDDVLGLKVEDILDRRLQTQVYKKGLARTVKQARQFIVHGHIKIGDKRIRSPGYLVTIDEENLIDWYKEQIQIFVETDQEEQEKVVKE